MIFLFNLAHLLLLRLLNIICIRQGSACALPGKWRQVGYGMHQPLSLHRSLFLCILYVSETFNDFIINQNVPHILTYIRATKD